MFDLSKLVRGNIRNLKAYSSPREALESERSILLDHNENSWGSVLPDSFNRYPDPFQRSVKAKLGELKGVSPDNIFIGNGSDEAVDLLLRIFGEPRVDKVLIFPPTYSMYEVYGAINDLQMISVPLTDEFDIDLDGYRGALKEGAKICFICSPNNPTGNSMSSEKIEEILRTFEGIVVLDEAYVDFVEHKSFLPRLSEFPNLVILQTFSKAWGLANLRAGMAFASPAIISLMSSVKPPYNVNGVTQQYVLEALELVERRNEFITTTHDERRRLEELLKDVPCISTVYPSDTNFLFVKTVDGEGVFTHLLRRGIVVRDRSKVTLCNDCLRITVGTEGENNELVEALKEFA